MAINHSAETTRPISPIRPEFRFSNANRPLKPEYSQTYPDMVFKNYDVSLPYTDLAVQDLIATWGDKYEFWFLPDGTKIAASDPVNNTPAAIPETAIKHVVDLYSYGKRIAQIAHNSADYGPALELKVVVDMANGQNDPNLVLISELINNARAFHSGKTERHANPTTKQAEHDIFSSSHSQDMASHAPA